jgi:hypothetical protein
MTAVGDPTIKHLPRQKRSWLLGEINCEGSDSPHDSCWRCCHKTHTQADKELTPGWDQLGILVPLITTVENPIIKHISRQIRSWLLGEINWGFWFPLWQLLEILPWNTYPGQKRSWLLGAITGASDSPCDSCLRSYHAAHTQAGEQVAPGWDHWGSSLWQLLVTSP